MGASNNINALRLQRQFNVEQASSVFNEGGGLTHRTPLTESPSGRFEMHFYKNSVTGDVYYGRDYKAVFEHQGRWNLAPRPNFDYEPPRFDN